MTKDLHAHSYIDHFLQADILSKLALSERPIRFSELKEDGIDNSLFMYHANKLITRGLVEKSDDGFTLTLKGVRWVNYAGVFHGFSITTPRPLVQFIIQDAQDNVMLAVRKGQLRQQLNDYLLPGNIYRYGASLDANAILILEELFGKTAPSNATFLTAAEIIYEFEDGFIHHVISHIFTLKLSSNTPPTHEHPLFDVIWTPIEMIKSSNPQYAKSTFLPMLFAKLPTLKSHETFLIKSQ